MQTWLETDLANDGAAAIAKVKKKKYDFVLMDLSMREMDGIAATENIRNELKDDVIIIAHSSDDSYGMIRKCMETGMDGFIRKTSDKKHLFNNILDILNRSKLARS